MKRARDPSPDASNKVPKQDDVQSSSESSLIELLDFTGITTHAEITSRFSKLADSLFHEYLICAHVNGKDVDYELLEFEYYLHKQECHEDPFTHQSHEQRLTGNWYFHRAPTRSGGPGAEPSATAGYRGGTRKGLDLTFGNPIRSPHFPTKSDETNETRAGILLRTIRRLHDQKVISGPSLLVDEVISVTGAEGISDLVQNKWKNNTTAFPAPSSNRESSMFMKKRTKSKEPSQVYSTPRIGLELSHPSAEASSTNPRVIYIGKPYRYIVHPDLLVANGRSQTFIGVYSFVIDSDNFDKEEKVVAEVARITGIKDKTIRNYVSDYKHGLDGGCSLNGFVGTKTTAVGKYLNMMGAVSAVFAE